MIINEEPVIVAIQQSTQMIEETLATNMKRFKGPHSKRRHHDTRRSKRSPRETGGDGNNSFNFQSKFYNNNNNSANNNNQHNNSHYRNFNGSEKSGPQFQYPFNHLNVQQSFQIHQQDPFQYQHQSQQQPTSPLRITPPMPSSNHPLSSFQTPNQQQHQQPVPTPPSNGQPIYMYQSQVQMPLPMQYPMPIPVSMPPVNYDGSPITPLQMPLHMPNMPLPVFIRLPAQPCMSPSVSSGNNEDTLKSSASSASINSLSSLSTTATTTTTTSTGNPPPPAAVVNFIPLLFPSHLGPMLFGPSQQIMVTPMSRSPNQFNQMVNDNGQQQQQQQQHQRTPTAPHHHQHHHHQSSTKSI